MNQNKKSWVGVGMKILNHVYTFYRSSDPDPGFLCRPCVGASLIARSASVATAIVGNLSSGGGSVPGELGAGTRAAEAPSQSYFAIWGQLIFSAESRRHLGCGDIAEAVA